MSPFNARDFNAVIRDLKAKRFYGTVELKFNNGELVLIRKTETYVPTAPQPRTGEEKNGNGN